MTGLNLSRRQFFARSGLLVVGFSIGQSAPGHAQARNADLSARSVEYGSLDSWLAIARDGSVTAYTGRVDLGTGTETALAQFVAEELDVSIARVHMVMGDTRLTPNQGKTTAALNMLRGYEPLRVAAAEARAALVRLAAEKLSIPATELEVVDGVVRPKSSSGGGISYGDLIGDQKFSITLQVERKTAQDIARGILLRPTSPQKAVENFRVVGTSVPRLDIPSKVVGTFQYVHNVRVPGMLHGRVVRPPAFGAKLLSVAKESIQGIAGARLVQRNDFVGIVAEREEDAIRAARVLRCEWTQAETLPDFHDVYDEIRRRKVIADRVAHSDGDIPSGLAKGKTRVKADYHFPFQDHAMIGPSCAVADVNADRALIWSGSQWPQGDRSDVAKMLGVPLENVNVIWREAAGSYGRLTCDDAAGDAAVMSQIVGRPVRVQWSREDEHGWEPISPAVTMTIEGACDANGRLTAFEHAQYASSHSAGERGNFLAWHAIGGAPGTKRPSGGAAHFWYQSEATRIRDIYVEPWMRCLYLRAPGGIQSIFGYESFMDELAGAAGIDPIEFRIRNTDERDRAVLETVARLSNWQPRRDSGRGPRDAAILLGRGVALARYGGGARRESPDGRTALVVDVEVERASGKVTVTRAFLAFDCGFAINPDGVLNQLEGGLLHGLSRTLHEQVRFDRKMVTSRDWKGYPVLRFAEVPDVQIELISRPDRPWSSASDGGHVATAAAVANAVSDAIGKRARRLPLDPDYVKSII